jgi:hypothetical protein
MNRITLALYLFDTSHTACGSDGYSQCEFVVIRLIGHLIKGDIPRVTELARFLPLNTNLAR